MSANDDIHGDWQGTLKAGPRDFRLVLKIESAINGGWRARLFSIDQGADWGAGAAVSSITLQDSQLKFAIAALRGSYEGTISTDRNSIEGIWTQMRSLPLELRRATPETAWKDPSPHTIQFVTVDDNVDLEVLDWGGSGRPLVFLAGLGNTAHAFDKLAPKLTATNHAYGVTRRGYGASSAPASGYSADRLGDDVLAVLKALNLSGPVLVGHSIAGEELSSVGSRFPDRVAGLIYLDAAYAYAYYNGSRGDLNIDLIELRRKLDQLANVLADTRPLIKELLETTLPKFEMDLREKQADLEATPAALLAGRSALSLSPIDQAVLAGQQKFTNIPVPILAIYAVPIDLGPLAGDAASRAVYEARNEATTSAQATAFERGVPTARVVRLANASHSVFVSHEADVLREMNAFLSSLL